ncbi:MAG: Rieske (2Fe-2S) protein [bacterium]|nr:Rieske (2Fe-2S) protein [bacterium]
MDRRNALIRLGHLVAAAGTLPLVAGCRDELGQVMRYVGAEDMALKIDARYELAPRLLRLGLVRDLLFPAQKIEYASALVVRDDEGWGAMSARCSREGCDLSWEETKLVCPCCRSAWNLKGELLGGKARHPLPWFKVGLREDLRRDYFIKVDGKSDIAGVDMVTISERMVPGLFIYMHTGLPVSKTDRYNHPKIESALKVRRSRLLAGEEPIAAEVSSILFEHNYSKGYWHGTPLTEEVIEQKYDITGTRGKEKENDEPVQAPTDYRQFLDVK